MPQIQFSSSTWIMLGVFAAVAAVAFWYRSSSRPSASNPFVAKLEGFQTGTDAAAAQLLGSPDVCKLVKNVMDSVAKQMQTAESTGNTAQAQILKISLSSLENEFKKLQCATA